MPDPTVADSMTIPSDPARFRTVRDWLAGVARRQGWNDRDALELALAANEACANIHRHAYRGREDGTIEIRIRVEDGSFLLRIRDRGASFGPEDYRPPDLENPEVGGYGVYLIRNLMDEVEYVSDGSVNELQMLKLDRQGTGGRRERDHVRNG